MNSSNLGGCTTDSAGCVRSRSDRRLSYSPLSHWRESAGGCTATLWIEKIYLEEICIDPIDRLATAVLGHFAMS
jgi:hypothetical protein